MFEKDRSSEQRERSMQCEVINRGLAVGADSVAA